MKDWNWPMLIAFVVIAVVMFIVSRVVKNNKTNKLIMYVQKGDMVSFNKEANTFVTKYSLPPFNLEYLRLNGYIFAGMEKEIDKQFDLLLRMRKSKAQTEDVTMRAFNYYVSLENKEKSEALLEKINTFTNERMKEEANIMYDVFILKNDVHIEEMEKELAEMDDDARKAIHEYLLSVQYRNKGDKKKAKEYENLSKEHMNKPLK